MDEDLPEPGFETPAVQPIPALTLEDVAERALAAFRALPFSATENFVNQNEQRKLDAVSAVQLHCEDGALLTWMMRQAARKEAKAGALAQPKVIMADFIGIG